MANTGCVSNIKNIKIFEYITYELYIDQNITLSILGVFWKCPEWKSPGNVLGNVPKMIGICPENVVDML